MAESNRYRRLNVLKISGICIGVFLRDQKTLSLLHDFAVRKEDFSEMQGCAIKTVELDEEDLQLIRSTYTEDIPFYSAEYNVLAGLISGRLHPYGRAVFHGVSFLWNNKAWILTAPSGTGKTTQYFHWKELYGDRVRILNGDKPVLQVLDHGTVLVHPSPWNGKEKLGCMETAELGGIIYLRQGKQNLIERMPPEQAVRPILFQFITFLKDAEQVHALCRIEETILRNIPVWSMTNTGDRASAVLLHDTLELYLRGNDKYGI